MENKGVFKTTKKDGSPYFRSSININGKHISLGSFENYDQAHGAYLDASFVYNNKEIGILDYPLQKFNISFEKYVILINFRDNNIYLGKPIYIKQKYFEYYLSLNCILKFDLDDLFYYSSHKIMQRGGHLFVADYGMQINLVSRYGIKNYAVIGKDYNFINGDRHDFRRENLEIKNFYTGVSLEKINNKFYYVSRIHVNGNLTIGKFLSATYAAIAYNKAIDVLKKNGINKNYSPNYIEEISPREYAEIYTEIKIPNRILKYKSKNISPKL